MPKYNFAGHDDGMNTINDGYGNFRDEPMTPGQLAAREPARLISGRIYELANTAGFAYIQTHEIIAPVIDAAISRQQQEIESKDAQIRVLKDGLPVCGALLHPDCAASGFKDTIRSQQQEIDRLKGDLEYELTKEKERADFAWKNTKIIDAARREAESELAALRGKVPGWAELAELYGCPELGKILREACGEQVEG